MTLTRTPRTKAGKALLARKVHSSNWTNDQGTLLDGIAAIEEEAVSQSREALDGAVNVVYGMRNYARHEDRCQFAQTITGIESDNQPCSCRFDEVLEAFDSFIEKARSLLQADQVPER